MAALLVLIALLASGAMAQGPPGDARTLAKAIAAARTDADRDALVEANRPLVTRALIDALLVEGNDLVRRADLPAAQALHALSRRLARDVGDLTAAIEATLAFGVTSGRKGEYVVAMAAFREAFVLSERAGDLAFQSQALNDMGIVHRRTGELDVALDDYQRSLALSEQLGDLPKQANTLNNIGIVLVQLGKYRLALEFYERSLAIKRRLDTPDVFTTIVNIGELHVQQGNPDLALKYYEEALGLAERQDVRLRSMSPLHGIGSVHESRGRYADALAYYGRALAIAEQASDKDRMALELFKIGVVRRMQGQLTLALEQFDRSLSLREAIGDLAGVAETLIETSIVQMRQRRFADALAGASRAATVAGEMGHRLWRWKALTLEGQAEHALGNVERARTSLLEAMGDIEAMRDDVAGGDELTQRFFEWRLDPYYALIDLNLSSGRVSDALGVAERMRGRVLLDALRFGRVDVTKSLTVEERAREQGLAREIAVATAQLDAARAARAPRGDIERLVAAVTSARLSQAANRASLYAAHPELRTRRGEVPEIDLRDARSLMPQGRSAAIEFAVTPERTYVFVIRPGDAAADVAVFTIDVTKQALTERVERFRGQLATRDLAIRAEARRLHALLLAPADSLLADRTSLTILPDGPLWSLPFQALETASGRYLIEQAAVSYAPSLAALREMKRLADTRAALETRRPLLAVGSSGASSPAVTLGGLPVLVEAEQQARQLAGVYGTGRSTLRLGADASGERLAQDLRNHRVVHIAAHGVFDDTSPMHSYVVLSPSRAGTAGARGDDGYVEAADLIEMDVQADLVVLSSCDTARGRIGDGEGLIGLSWALFVAGTPSVVVSQWKVDATSTTRLMRLFHQRIASGLVQNGGVTGRAAALREASLALLRNPQWSHPFYWAPFVLVGDGS